MYRLFTRRTLVVPTLFGWGVLFLIFAMPVVLWGLYGEQFLAATSRVSSDVLVVEAWTQESGARAAIREYHRVPGQYRYIVTAGGLTGEPWNRRRWHEVTIVERELQRAGIPSDVIVAAEAPDVEAHRTFYAAVAARRALDARDIHPKGINVVTRGAHARRSRLTFAKAFDSKVQIGVVAWLPPGFTTEPWWRSSERSVDFLKESFGYVYELVFSSGRPLQNISDRKLKDDPPRGAAVGFDRAGSVRTVLRPAGTLGPADGPFEVVGPSRQQVSDRTTSTGRTGPKPNGRASRRLSPIV